MRNQLHMQMQLTIEPTKTMLIGCRLLLLLLMVSMMKDNLPILWPIMMRLRYIQQAVSSININININHKNINININHKNIVFRRQSRRLGKERKKEGGRKATTKTRPISQNPIPPFLFPPFPLPFFAQINLPPAKPAAGWNCVESCLIFAFFDVHRTY